LSPRSGNSKEREPGPVATPAALYRLTKATVRPLDRQDAAALRERFGL
jgi:hypothetical protein